MADDQQEVLVPVNKQGDLHPLLLAHYDWSKSAAEKSLEELFDHARTDAEGAISWYLRKKRPKKLLATVCRVFALGMGGVAALLPLLSQLVKQTPNPGGVLGALQSIGVFEPVSVTIVLALAAGAFVVDRAWGGSSGWLRFIATELKLRDQLEAFELDWQRERARWAGQPPTPAQVDMMFDKVAAFTALVNATVQEETRMWMEDFRASLRELEDALKTRRETARQEAAKATDAVRAKAERAAQQAQPAAANVTITNAAQLEGGRWTLVIDESEPRTVSGANAAVPKVEPGVRVFSARGKISGQAVTAERVVEVRPGAIAVVELTLA